ncbi:hypothetical protein [Microcoleus sp. B3-A4]
MLTNNHLIAVQKPGFSTDSPIAPLGIVAPQIRFLRPRMQV